MDQLICMLSLQNIHLYWRSDVDISLSQGILGSISFPPFLVSFIVLSSPVRKSTNCVYIITSPWWCRRCSKSVHSLLVSLQQWNRPWYDETAPIHIRHEFYQDTCVQYFSASCQPRTCHHTMIDWFEIPQCMPTLYFPNDVFVIEDES